MIERPNETQLELHIGPFYWEYVVVYVLQRQVWSGCSGSGDYVELLGGNGVDTSKMFPVADLCFAVGGLGESLSSLAHRQHKCFAVGQKVTPAF